MILFFVNMSAPLLNKQPALLIPVIISSLSVFLYMKMNSKYGRAKVVCKKGKQSNVRPYFMFVFLMIVFIARGFSYEGIYPGFKTYATMDRYYNVFFFLVAIIIEGHILDLYGRKIAFTVGVGLLGISFTFFTAFLASS